MLTAMAILALAVLVLAVPAVALLRQHHRTDLDRQMRRLIRQHRKDHR